VSRLSKLKPTAFVLEQDGEVIVNRGWVEASSEGVVALCFDLATKYAQTAGFSYTSETNLSGLFLCATQGTLFTNENKKGEFTHILFSDYPGWHVHCADVGRYTLNVCLVKDSP